MRKWGRNMFCTKCGNQMEEGAAFCAKCGNKVGETPTAESPNVVIKSKKECIHAGFCQYLQGFGMGATYSELENYEEGQKGKVYCEIVRSTRDLLGRTKKLRYGVVINEVEADGNCVFQSPDPQLFTPMVKTKTVQRVLRFKSLK